SIEARRLVAQIGIGSEVLVRQAEVGLVRDLPAEAEAQLEPVVDVLAERAVQLAAQEDLAAIEARRLAGVLAVGIPDVLVALGVQVHALHEEAAPAVRRAEVRVGAPEPRGPERDVEPTGELARDLAVAQIDRSADGARA